VVIHAASVCSTAVKCRDRGKALLNIAFVAAIVLVRGDTDQIELGCPRKQQCKGYV
jgi:hypothetical protein